MGIFPSKHEERLTLAILAFTSGTGFGLFVYYLSDDFDSALPALTTLLAAFLGAWFAFLFQNRHEEKKARDRELAAANKLLYIMLERLNSIALLKKDLIDPNRHDKEKMISIRPNLNFNPPMTSIDLDGLTFVLKSASKQLMSELHVSDAFFRETVSLVQYRSHIHLNVYQPLVERTGHRIGEELTNLQIKEAIGQRNYAMLEQLTNDMIKFVDDYINEADKLREKFTNYFSLAFDDKELFKFELLENS